MARAACVSQLLSVANAKGAWDRRSAAMGHLIELVHLTDHPTERAQLVRALGRTG